MPSSPSATQQSAIEATAHILQRMVERASVDPDLRRRLIADPRAVLAEHGLAIPAGVEVEVEETGRAGAAAVVRRITACRLVVPLPALRGSSLSDDQLDAIVGGVDFRAAALCYAIAPLAIARALVIGADADAVRSLDSDTENE